MHWYVIKINFTSFYFFYVATRKCIIAYASHAMFLSGSTILNVSSDAEVGGAVTVLVL